MTSLKIALPNELWSFILSDVIGTYIHSFLLLPPSCPCWPAYYVLRCVSKWVKALVDDIWISVIGSGDMGQRHLANIRDAFLVKREAPVPGRGSTPLITAYSCYVVALYGQDIPRYRIDLDNDLDGEPLTPQSSHGKWLQTGFALAHNVRPREAAYLLQAHLKAAVTSYFSDINTSTTRLLIKGTLELAARHASLSGEQLERLLESVCFLRTASLRGDAEFMEYKHTVAFETAGRSLVQQPPDELAVQYQKSDDILREKTASSMALLNATWLERIATQESRKRELHRVATYGIRRQSLTES